MKTLDPFTDIVGHKRGSGAQEIKNSSFLEAITGSKLPFGLTVVRGSSGAGKTAAAVLLSADLLRTSQRAVYLDYDNANANMLCKAQGIDDKFAAIAVQPGSGINIIESLILDKNADVIIIDSLHNLVYGEVKELNLYQRTAAQLNHLARFHKVPIIATYDTQMQWTEYMEEECQSVVLQKAFTTPNQRQMTCQSSMNDRTVTLQLARDNARLSFTED